MLNHGPLRALARLRTRRALQTATLIIAVAIVAHGFLGPQDAPRNLATVVTWVLYRGLLVVALLALGNLFCAVCPMMLVRDVARRVVTPRWPWPRALRNKWLAVALLAAGLFAYEQFDLWSLPFVTAISLGPRIMRADTAGVAALTLVQAALGDWNFPFAQGEKEGPTPQAREDEGIERT